MKVINMNLKKKVLFILLLSFSANSYSIDRLPIDKKEWLLQIKASLPTAFCSSDQIFMQCYRVNTNECYLTIGNLFEQCATQQNSTIPNIIKTDKLSRKLGGTLGKCIALTFGRIMKNKVKNNRRCNKIYE